MTVSLTASAAACSTLFLPHPCLPRWVVFVALDAQTVRSGRMHVRNLPPGLPAAALLPGAEEMEAVAIRASSRLHPVCAVATTVPR